MERTFHMSVSKNVSLLGAKRGCSKANVQGERFSFMWCIYSDLLLLNVDKYGTNMGLKQHFYGASRLRFPKEHTKSIQRENGKESIQSPNRHHSGNTLRSVKIC
nr:MAG TPA: hypothetical protein [Caudoviricetes sp.]